MIFYLISQSLIYNYLRQYFQNHFIKYQGLTRSMKNKKITRFKGGTKNKIIKKLDNRIIKKQQNQLHTSNSLLLQSQVQQLQQDPIIIRQYRQQLKFVKNIMTQVYNLNNFSNSKIFQQIDLFKNSLHFPTISVDKLFDYHSNNIFNGSFISYDLFDYLKLLNNQFQNKRKNIILSTSNDVLLLTQQVNRRQKEQEFKGKFITFLEREVLQNRSNFMEKIKVNQSKYQNCNSQLSQISQQMLFLSKTYMQNSSKIKKLGDQISQRMSQFFPQPKNEAQKIYFQVITKKNIAYALQEKQINLLNYFPLKQSEERNIHYQNNPMRDQNQFINYLKNKKSKKGKFARLGLPTACSCCFSGYYQSVNPLITCQNCNLRCHKICYDLKQNSCGNCSYQRILKSEKQNTPYCMICEQKGEMTIKLKNKLYVHGFCLLVHGLWKIQHSKQIKQNENQLQKDFLSLYYKKNSITDYQFKSIKQKQPKISIIYGGNILEYENSLNQKDKSQGNFQHGFEQFLNLDNSHVKKIQEQSQKCKICFKKFHQKLYLDCSRCHSKCHAFCAFFNGENLKYVQKKNSQQGSKINILFDCCSKSVQEKEKLKKSREYILNRNRFLFQNI